MNILICDDEHIYVQNIKKHVSNYFDEKRRQVSIDDYVSGTDILNNLKYYDIAFLDIEIDDVNGIEVANALKKINPNIIVFFITAYQSYLDEAMDLYAFRYLSKPLNVSRMYSGLDKAIKLIDNSLLEVIIREKKTISKIYANDIIYVEIIGRFTKVITKNVAFETENDMNYWNEKLIAYCFFKTHKSFIINANYITKYERNHVILNNNYYIPIAYRTQAKFRHYYFSLIEGR